MSTEPQLPLHVGKRTEEAKTLVTPQMHDLLAEKARVVRAITQQPPQYDRSYIAQPSAGAAAARAIRNSQIEAQKRSRRAVN